MDDEFRNQLSSNYLQDIANKDELMERINELMLRKIPTHSRRVQALSEPKRTSETSSMFLKESKFYTGKQIYLPCHGPIYLPTSASLKFQRQIVTRT